MTDNPHEFQYTATVQSLRKMREALREARAALDTIETPSGSSGLETIRQGKPIKTWIDDALNS